MCMYNAVCACKAPSYQKTRNLPFRPEGLWVLPQLRVMVNAVNGYGNSGVLWDGYSIDTCFFNACTECPDGAKGNVK